mgnify:CR=1 FL=1
MTFASPRLSLPFRVLFVCTGNICRSPTAEGVFRAHVQAAGLGEHIIADSAATTCEHCGQPPDPRTRAAARQRGLDLSALRARQIHKDDFSRFDQLLAMDHSHLRYMQRLSPPAARDKVQLFLDFAPGQKGRDVPDPYYGGREGFQQVLDLAEAGAGGLLAWICRQTGLDRP